MRTIFSSIPLFIYLSDRNKDWAWRGMFSRNYYAAMQLGEITVTCSKTHLQWNRNLILCVSEAETLKERGPKVETS